MAAQKTPCLFSLRLTVGLSQQLTNKQEKGSPLDFNGARERLKQHLYHFIYFIYEQGVFFTSFSYSSHTAYFLFECHSCRTPASPIQSKAPCIEQEKKQTNVYLRKETPSYKAQTGCSDRSFSAAHQKYTNATRVLSAPHSILSLVNLN